MRSRFFAGARLGLLDAGAAGKLRELRRGRAEGGPAGVGVRGGLALRGTGANPPPLMGRRAEQESEFESGTTTLSQSDWLHSRFDTTAWLRARSPFCEDPADDRNEYMNNYEDWLRAWPQERMDVAFLPPWKEICGRHA